MTMPSSSHIRNCGVAPARMRDGQQTQRYLNVTDEELRKGLEVSWKNKGRPLRLASGA
jgi:hypothetical protein